ncbi:AraC family transcriptional regulator [Rhodocytophaga rosea]|uniref:AraC family transcriptional regulator n=1 Tax=Rhodocytophaga rosea TaxID=2704465 RepID=A0A6C0GHW1_9BACT|nr:AraC family transcriptional regulator [Rhodocytophaga rosea]QHT67272.1 AraC family transcriptional regulator [Rhodocytophaga rosea]
MKLELIQPHPELRPYIGKMWVFENSRRLPDENMKVIVPNGMAKLIIPLHNGLLGKYKDWSHLSKESSITLIGIADSPAIVDVEHDAPHINIGLEFSPLGTYRLFQLRHSEIKNKIFPLEEILGTSARRINERIANTEPISQKIHIIQSYLRSLLSKSSPDVILDYCLQQIASSKGLIAVSELEQKTGYSSRWLYEKFIEKVGISPKTLSSVTRFMQFYQASAGNPTADFFREDIYHYFYDQAHFIKEFKRFTGLPPVQFIKTDNQFGHIFYKD